MKTLPYMTKESFMNNNIKQNRTSKSMSKTISKNRYYRTKFSMESLAILLVLIMLIFAIISIFVDKKSKAAFNTVEQKYTLLNTNNIETLPSITPAYSSQITSQVSSEIISSSINEEVPYDKTISTIEPVTIMPVEDLAPISAIQMLEPSDNLELGSNGNPSSGIELSSRSNTSKTSESDRLEEPSQGSTPFSEESLKKTPISEEISSGGKTPTTEEESSTHDNTSQSSTSSKITRGTLVVIDPGHGGIDPGTCSIYKEGLYEKDINLDIALRLKKMLVDAGISVIMTRETDTEVYKSKTYNYNENIYERPRIANNNNATLFISIHVNAFDTNISGGKNYNGTEIYYATKTHGEYTNKQFAEIMGNAIDAKTDTKYNGVRNKSLGVLRLSNMPALLIETAYLTNKEDHKLLESGEFRADMAEGIYDGAIKILQAIGL